MIKIDNIEVFGWETAIRGMRNPMNSWEKSDSYPAVACKDCGRIDREGHCEPYKHQQDCRKYECYEIGPNDLKLMQSLIKAGNDHSKFMRMINVTMDRTAPLYWWKEFDTYKVGTVANSCSTMHKIHSKEFTLEDFSHEHLFSEENLRYEDEPDSLKLLKTIIQALNSYRLSYLDEQDKSVWWQMIQLLPSSYNQKRTVQLNYQVLRNIYFSRKNHKLDEWHDFCHMIEELPYGKELICYKGEDKNET